MFAATGGAAEEEGKILRPADGAAFVSGSVDVVATAPGGKLELDGQEIEAEEPFPNVFHAKIQVSPGEHALTLVWEGGRRRVRFFTGDDPPAGFLPFQQHPTTLAEVPCTQCHGLSRRGRFRFVGGCFDCHRERTFTATHPHEIHVLEECGMCHNAHGSTAKALLLYPKEIACKLCHS